MAKKKSANKAKPVKVASAPDPAKKFAHVVNKPLRKALMAAGGGPQLAAALNVSRQAVHKWEAIPDRLAVEVERLYKIPREEIAPHLYAK